MRIAGKSSGSFQVHLHTNGAETATATPHGEHTASETYTSATSAATISAGRSPSWARSHRQWVGYFTYKWLASTDGKMAGFELATSSWQEKF